MEQINKNVLRILEKEKKTWFQPNKERTTATWLLEGCILPRCKFSVADALFCAKFAYLLQHIQTPNFSFLEYCAMIFYTIGPLTFSCTEAEATRFGLFVRETLALLQKWRTDRNVFLEDSATLKAPNKGTVDYLQYRRIFASWETYMTNTFSALLSSAEYMEVHNTLIILSKIVSVYPSYKKLAELIEKQVNRLKAQKERKDLQALAERYGTLLEKQKERMSDDEEYRKDSGVVDAPKAKVPNNESRPQIPRPNTTPLRSPAPISKAKIGLEKEIKSTSRTESSVTPGNAKAADIPLASVTAGVLKESPKERTPASDSSKETPPLKEANLTMEKPIDSKKSATSPTPLPSSVPLSTGTTAIATPTTKAETDASTKQKPSTAPPTHPEKALTAKEVSVPTSTLSSSTPSTSSALASTPAPTSTSAPVSVLSSVSQTSATMSSTQTTIAADMSSASRERSAVTAPEKGSTLREGGSREMPSGKTTFPSSPSPPPSASSHSLPLKDVKHESESKSSNDVSDSKTDKEKRSEQRERDKESGLAAGVKRRRDEIDDGREKKISRTSISGIVTHEKEREREKDKERDYHHRDSGETREAREQQVRHRKMTKNVPIEQSVLSHRFSGDPLKSQTEKDTRSRDDKHRKRSSRHI